MKLMAALTLVAFEKKYLAYTRDSRSGELPNKRHR
jgi:hypothetical protein